MDALVTEIPRPPDLHFTMTGEKFEFQTSAKTGDGVFRFRWTLQKGKKGPPEHIHDGETETFAIVSGTLRIWLDGVPQDLGPGQRVAVTPGVRHRFFNPGQEPVVVDVSLDGPKMEDSLVPVAYRLGGSTKVRVSDIFVATVHGVAYEGSKPPSRVARAIFRGLAGVFRLFGVRPLPLAGPWGADAVAAPRAQAHA